MLSKLLSCNQMPFVFLFQGQLELQLKTLYDNVETFILFVGHPRSGHSLIAAILDSHPEIIISDEFNLLAKFNSFFMDANTKSDIRRVQIFFQLHERSRKQAMFGNRAPNCSSHYCYNIPGSWQGIYRRQIKVKFTFAFSLYINKYINVDSSPNMGHIVKLSCLKPQAYHPLLCGHRLLIAIVATYDHTNRGL